MTPEQSSALAEQFGKMRVHLATGDVYFQECIETSEAFLENRAARHDFGESLH